MSLIYSSVDRSRSQAYCCQPKHKILCFEGPINTICCVGKIITINYNTNNNQINTGTYT